MKNLKSMVDDYIKKVLRNFGRENGNCFPKKRHSEILAREKKFPSPTHTRGQVSAYGVFYVDLVWTSTKREGPAHVHLCGQVSRSITGFCVYIINGWPLIIFRINLILLLSSFIGEKRY